MSWIEQFKRGDDRCKHVWGDEKGERHLDHFMWWRVCTKCGEKRTTRSLDRGAGIEIFDWVSGVRYVIGSSQNLARTEFRYLNCDCGNSVRVDFELACIMAAMACAEPRVEPRHLARPPQATLRRQVDAL